MTSLYLLADTAPTTTGGAAAAFLPLLLAVGFVFLLMMPQRRMRKQQAALQEALQVGDLVRTAGGIHGRIISLDESSAVIEVESGRLRLERRAIAGKLEA
ncbi:MAG: preprotein translocase subunit YajC [Acidimicrobiia bacterium]|nr:preprotein translocase subunit YajC [Acidimicrobiia bacterium]MDH4306346.1 preprotein translocase subunit YajC [Acidimicrobiia bacterium]MDH5292517.1 preprotein translocase subunit YajC [Acidimicrobiia bacterium]